MKEGRTGSTGPPRKPLRALSSSLAKVSPPWDPGNRAACCAGRCQGPESGSRATCTIIASCLQANFSSLTQELLETVFCTFEVDKADTQKPGDSSSWCGTQAPGFLLHPAPGSLRIPAARYTLILDPPYKTIAPRMRPQARLRSMLSESERRAAALAVIRYGVDKVRVKEAARSVQRAQAEGRQADVVGALLQDNLLSAAQAEQIRLELDKTHIDLNGNAAKQAVSAPAPAATEEPRAAGPDPRRLGDYQILRRLGEGGMGAVFLGYHEKTGRHVAIKVLSEQLAGNAAYVDRF